MNTAVRTLTQSVVTPKWLAKSLLSRTQCLTCILVGAVAVSALAVIIISNQARTVTLNLQHAQAHERSLDVEYGQWLLEQAALNRGTRVATIAQNNLDMVIPHNRVMID